jgi:hypothetical protein
MKILFKHKEIAVIETDRVILKKRRMENKCQALNNSYSSFNNNNHNTFSLKNNYIKSAATFNTKNTTTKSKGRRCLIISEDKGENKENIISIKDKGSSTLNVTELKQLVQNVRTENKIIEDDIKKLHQIKNEALTYNSLLL